MRREDSDFVTQILQAYCSIDNKTFSTANAKVWVEEDDILLSRRHDYCLEDIASRCHLRALRHQVRSQELNRRSPNAIPFALMQRKDPMTTWGQPRLEVGFSKRHDPATGKADRGPRGPGPRLHVLCFIHVLTVVLHLALGSRDVDSSLSKVK